MQNRRRQIIQWAVLAAVVIAFAVLLSVGTVAATLPGCESCHLKGAFAKDTRATAHGSVKCAACHVDPSVEGRIAFATRQVFGMALHLVPVGDRDHAQVDDARCRSCHAEVTKPIVLGTRALRIKHSTCVDETPCMECHSVTGHGASTRWPRTSQMEACYECHGRSNQVTKCDACHAKKTERQRLFNGAFRVTHGPTWEQTHGMGDQRACVACHDDKKCGKCHGVGVPHGEGFLDRHAEFSVSKQAKCTACHLKRFCSDCHAYPMPHAQKFILNHSDTVDKDGKKKCLNCHAESDCTQCHENHVHPVTEEQMRGFMLKGGSR